MRAGGAPLRRSAAPPPAGPRRARPAARWARGRCITNRARPADFFADAQLGLPRPGSSTTRRSSRPGAPPAPPPARRGDAWRVAEPPVRPAWLSRCVYHTPESAGMRLFRAVASILCAWRSLHPATASCVSCYSLPNSEIGLVAGKMMDDSAKRWMTAIESSSPTSKCSRTMSMLCCVAWRARSSPFPDRLCFLGVPSSRRETWAL